MEFERQGQYGQDFGPDPQWECERYVSGSRGYGSLVRMAASTIWPTG
ncbi:MAG TPA: hypothetical protein VKG25_04170 [Bryobacteraceae bacterium]|nr:hypothetical protein [Bryobacteraceae bacterium]